MNDPALSDRALGGPGGIIGYPVEPWVQEDACPETPEHLGEQAQPVARAAQIEPATDGTNVPADNVPGVHRAASIRPDGRPVGRCRGKRMVRRPGPALPSAHHPMALRRPMPGATR